MAKSIRTLTVAEAAPMGEGMSLDAVSSAMPSMAAWNTGGRSRAVPVERSNQASAPTGAPSGDDPRAATTGSGGRKDQANTTGAAAPDDEARARVDRAAGASPAHELTDEQRREVDKLKARDAEVRAHEAAHMAAGGSHVRGGATYSFQQGPDGKAYAIGGEVGIDVSAVPNNPQATIQKMQQVRAAALAPAEPSGADRAVASAAAQTEARARAELAEAAAQRVTTRYGASSTAAREPGSRINASA